MGTVRRFLRHFAAAAALLFCAPQVVAAEPARMSEAQVKLAYLYNFASFAEWPATAFATPGSPLVICIFGRSELGESVAALSGRVVRNRKIQVRQVDAVEEIGTCHILFVAASEQGRLRRIVSELGSAPVLTVSDMKLFVHSGGMIGLLPQGGRLRFEINLTNSERVGLKLSSQLLKLATSVLQ